jgi:hypothetical protein
LAVEKTPADMCETNTIIPKKKYSLSRDILGAFRESYQSHPKRKLLLQPKHIEAMNKMSVCRTSTLGGVMYACEGCGQAHFIHRSCKHRFCVTCGAKDTNRWAEEVLGNLLNIRHSHVVVTLPAWLRGISQRNGNVLHNLLFSALKAVLLDWFAKKHGIEPGIVMVLHTAGSDLKYHPHVHCIVSFGGIERGGQVKVLEGDFLVNHKFLRSRFRHVFEGKLIAMYDKAQLKVPDNLLERKYFMGFLRRNNEKDWIVSIQEPLKDATSIVRYVFRYAKRACLSERKIEHIDGEQITLRYNDYKNTPKGAVPKQGYVTLHYVDFLDRLLQHVPEKGYRQVRYAGIYEGRKRKNLPEAWKLPPTPSDEKEILTEEQGAFWQYRKDAIEQDGRDPFWCDTCQQVMVFVAELMPTTRTSWTLAIKEMQRSNSS